ncbi:MAG: glutaminase [Muribaculaceae bacterium]|nr:glutaminase [Muribaculaceae bacterium]
MERTIALSELRNVVEQAYEEFKDGHEGRADQHIKDIDPQTFGISVVLADGTVINTGDAGTQVPIGDIADIPFHQLLLTQKNVDQIVSLSGEGIRFRGRKPHKPHHTGINVHGVRATSALEPTGDPDEKWNFIISNLINLMGGDSPVLDDRLYKSLQAQNATNGVEQALTDAGYQLYDSLKTSVDLYTRLSSMRASARQLATMGATIAADGVCPTSGDIVFDGTLSSTVVAMMAAMGPHRISRPWLISTGLPAKSGFGGAIFGALPGVMGIAAVSPQLDGAGTSVKGIKSLTYIMRRLGLSAFSSTRITIDKDK